MISVRSREPSSVYFQERRTPEVPKDDVLSGLIVLVLRSCLDLQASMEPEPVSYPRPSNVLCPLVPYTLSASTGTRLYRTPSL